MRVLACERCLIESSLLEHDGNIVAVLDALKINRHTLHDKMAKLGIMSKKLTAGVGVPDSGNLLPVQTSRVFSFCSVDRNHS